MHAKSLTLEGFISKAFYLLGKYVQYIEVNIPFRNQEVADISRPAGCLFGFMCVSDKLILRKSSSQSENFWNKQ